MSKLILKAETLQFPVDKDLCELSEILKREYFERETMSDFSAPHEIPLSKTALPSMIAFLTTVKMKTGELKRAGPEPALTDLNSPFQKLIKDLDLDSPAFQQLVNFQKDYKCAELSEHIAYFVHIKTRGKKDKELCDALGLVYDGDEIDSRLRDKIRQQVLLNR